MQPLGDDLNWFRTSSLDVMLFVTFVALVSLSIVIFALLAMYRKLIRNILGHRHAKHVKSA